MESFTEVVNLVKAIIKDQISDTAYNVWIKVIEPVRFENNQAVIQIKTPFQRDVLIKHYLEKFEAAFEAVLGFPVEVLIVTEDEFKSMVDEKDLPQAALTDQPSLPNATVQSGYDDAFWAIRPEIMNSHSILLLSGHQQLCLCRMQGHYNGQSNSLV